MSNKSRNLIAAETNLIRKYLDQRLELGKSHEDIMQELRLVKPHTTDMLKELWSKTQKHGTKISRLCKI